MWHRLRANRPGPCRHRRASRLAKDRADRLARISAEAWLAASTHGIETKGYEPSELDRATLAKMQGDFDHSNKTVAFTRDRTSAGPQAPHRASGPTVRDWKGGTDDRNERSHLAVIERVVLAAFPKDPAARKRVLDAARERMRDTVWRGVDDARRSATDWGCLPNLIRLSASSSVPNWPMMMRAISDRDRTQLFPARACSVQSLRQSASTRKRVTAAQ